MAKKIILTGDRPTGPLHLGHYVGSLENRLRLQNDYQTYILIADQQALTDHWKTPEILKENIIQVTLDYLAIGLDPALVTICVQSHLPAICELTMYYLNLVTVNQLHHNPTVKTEIREKGFEKSLPCGFFMYPVSQAADITAFKAHLVPVGEDQRPMIEQTNEIVRHFNRLYGQDTLVECELLVPKVGGRLVGLDGKAKMSKSLGNAIYLGDSEKQLKKKINKMFTDPKKIHLNDPGHLEGHVPFMYLDLFDSDKETLKNLKAHYERGGLGDGEIKKRLFDILNEKLSPIRQKREELSKDKGEILALLRKGTDKAKEVTEKTLDEVKSAMQFLTLRH
ncbi:MAG: tryptophan--tRNA ligase [Bacteriovoracales bacterium]|nr:tryptophan--tRNA ligase [Bacteriovoracales bacterium]